METLSKEDCWLWAGDFYGSGHGSLYIGQGKHTSAYRVVYENTVGDIPEGLELDHLCENPPCVNPEHLEPVTHQENTLRHYRRRTHCNKGHSYAEYGYTKLQKSNRSGANPTGETRKCRQCTRESDTRIRQVKRSYSSTTQERK